MAWRGARLSTCRANQKLFFKTCTAGFWHQNYNRREERCCVQIYLSKIYKLLFVWSPCATRCGATPKNSVHILLIAICADYHDFHVILNELREPWPPRNNDYDENNNNDKY